MRVAILYRLCVANTTNLFYHLQINHPEEHKEVVIKKKVAIQLERKRVS